MAIFVTSDLHLNHAGVIEMGRKFNSVQEHNEFIISEINKVVGKDDLFYILGDVLFGSFKELKKWIPLINGRKVLILGNHDRRTIGEYKSAGFIEVYNHPVYYSRHLILSHEPAIEAFNNPYVYNVHGHIHFNDLDLPNFINVNIELTNYKPVSLTEIEEKVSGLVKSRRETFGKEWYYNYYRKENKNGK